LTEFHNTGNHQRTKWHKAPPCAWITVGQTIALRGLFEWAFGPRNPMKN
jgi:hypothetical protein